ncbi:hypothetical protein SDJN02_09312 [Cucurbita argyrosperma subsp. argyrosperma]|nr:hypothetical protein SDJN02_09312 [Cucurbita argyrosperma subsp. argyrosperma]
MRRGSHLQLEGIRFQLNLDALFDQWVSCLLLTLQYFFQISFAYRSFPIFGFSMFFRDWRFELFSVVHNLVWTL